ncbi:MAG: C_GCAxxG_C_C family protein [Clostridia bacterium]|nr:C_GCAxxG_C_C family protein [Clostridia bacterium]
MEKNRKEEAIKNFREGYNCSQSVIKAYADVVGIDEEKLLSLSSTLGTGMGGLKQTCGAVSAMFMILGAVENKIQTDPLERANLYKKVRELAGKFQEENNSINCKDLIDYTMSDEFDEKFSKEKFNYKRPCEKFVLNVCEIIDKFILDV